MIPAIEPSVDINPWLACTWGLTWRVILPGLAWGWLLPAWRIPDLNRWLVRLLVCVQSLLVGFLLALLSSFILIEAGLFRTVHEILTTGCITLAGGLLGWFFQRESVKRYLQHGFPGMIVCMLGFAVIMNLPHRGEWMVGGWDPGIYVNNGMAIAREGTSQLPPSTAFTDFTPDELPVFTRIFGTVVEVFPGVPINPQTRQYRLYFFPLMPTLVALMDHAGGLRAATRVNTFVGWSVLLALPALLFVHGRKATYALFGALLLLAQPAWLYHLHTPTSEMLQLLLLIGLFFAMPFRRESAMSAIAMGSFLLAATLNRLGFLPFGTLLVAVLAWLDVGRPDRGRVWAEHIFFLVCLGLGARLDFIFSSSTTGRLEDILPGLLWTSAIFTMMVILFDGIASMANVRSMLSATSNLMARMVGTIICITLVALWFAGNWGPTEVASLTLHRLTHFFTPSLMLAAFVGFIALTFSSDERFHELHWLVIFLAASVLVLLVQKNIADLYPWTTRRFLTEATLLLVLAGAYPPVLLWSSVKTTPWIGRALAVGFVVLVLAPALVQSSRVWTRAWTVTEYDGISKALVQVARQIGPEDIVVADHFKWGTPLALIYGKNVINGERLWAPDNRNRSGTGFDALRRLVDLKRRIRFLTSTETGMKIYPHSIGTITEDWSAPAQTYEEIIHHRNADSYETRTNEVQFKLYSVVTEPET